MAGEFWECENCGGAYNEFAAFLTSSSILDIYPYYNGSFDEASTIRVSSSKA